MIYIKPFLVFLLTLGVFWIGGMDFTTRHPELGGAFTVAILLTTLFWPNAYTKHRDKLLKETRDVIDSSNGHDR